MKLTTVIDIAALLAVASLLFYAFTGMPLWLPIDGSNLGDFGRLLILTVAHIAPILIAIFRRLP